MKKFLSFLFFLSASYQIQTNAKITIHTIGDSTMANKSTSSFNPEVGWGMVFPWLVDTAQVTVVNYGADGRSTKSFIDEGRWSTALANLKSGDYVFIQFGHNDEKYFDATLYTNPSTTFKSNLVKFINESKAKGANPVLLTSIVRRSFEASGKLVDTHGVYPDAMRRVADSLKVLLIDMELKTRRLESIAGIDGAKKIHLFFNPGETPYATGGKIDNTHLSEFGALNIAFLVAEGIRELQLPIPLSNSFHNNLVKNWSFEYGTSSLTGTNVPLDWKLEQNLAGTKDIKVSSAIPKDRTYKYSIWASQVTAINLYQDIILPAGQYQLSASMHTSSAGDVTNQRLYVQVKDEAEMASNTLSYIDNAANYWIPLNVSFTVPEGKCKVRIGARSTGNGTTAAGHFTIDNVRLVKTNELTSLQMAYSSLLNTIEDYNSKLSTYTNSLYYNQLKNTLDDVKVKCANKSYDHDGIVTAIQNLRDAETKCKWSDKFPADMTFSITNPAFEEGVLFPHGLNVAMGWSLIAKIGGSTTVNTSSATPADGVYKFSVWAAQVNAIDLFQDIKLPSGKYTLSVMLHTTSAGDVTNQHLYVKSGTDSVSSKFLTFDAANYWVPVTVNFNVPENDMSVRIGASSTGLGTSAGHFMIDKFNLQKISDITAATNKR